MVWLKKVALAVLPTLEDVAVEEADGQEQQEEEESEQEQEQEE